MIENLFILLLYLFVLLGALAIGAFVSDIICKRASQPKFQAQRRKHK